MYGAPYAQSMEDNMKPKKSRVIVGAVFNDKQHDPKILAVHSFTFAEAAWDDYLRPRKCPLRGMIEGEWPSGLTRGADSPLMWCNLAQMEKLIQHIETADGKQNSRGNYNKEPAIVLGIGSREFCQSVIHFWATSRTGNVSRWGLHLIRQMTTVELGTAVWYDSQDGLYHQENILEMFLRLQGATASPET